MTKNRDFFFLSHARFGTFMKSDNIFSKDKIYISTVA